MTTSWGGRDLSEMRSAIPNLVEIVDESRDPMGSFIRSLEYTNEASVHMEDDIDLCDNFVQEIESAIAQYPNDVINFFSLRKKDYEVRKPFFETGSKYMANLCFYLPSGMPQEIVNFYNTSWARKFDEPNGLDLLIADYLKSKKQRYLQWFPHLVNHKVGRSLINGTRSSQRTDKLFTK